MARVVSIIATFLYPPLLRDNDWEAFYEDDELDEDMPRGYGRTAQGAIDDLRSRFPRK